MKWFLTISAIVTLGLALLAGFLEHSGILLIGSLASAVLLIMANLDQIAEFKASGAGIEAKTREVLARAQNTLNELQLLSKIVASISLSLVKRSGRLGGYSEDEQDQIKSSVLTVLKNIGIPEKELSDVLIDWNKFTEFDYAYGILGSNVPSDLPQKEVEEWNNLRADGLDHIPSPEAIEKFLQKVNKLTPERQELLADYRHYIEHHEHRRPDVWLKRGEWPGL